MDFTLRLCVRTFFFVCDLVLVIWNFLFSPSPLSFHLSHPASRGVKKEVDSSVLPVTDGLFAKHMSLEVDNTWVL